MLSFSVAVPLIAAAFAVAQSTDIAAIEAHIEQSGIESALLQNFSPTAALGVTFDGTVGAITTPGQKLTVAEVQPTPQLDLTPANSSITFSGDYTIAMLDADIVGADTSQVTRHWLVNGAKIENNKINSGSVSVITPYGAPLPADGSGSHRYVIVVYQQPEGFTAPASPPQNAPIEKMNFGEYVTNAKLVGPVAANYIQVEQGTAATPASATSSVVSSTLAAAASASGSASGTSTGSASAATASKSAAPNSAVSALQFGFVPAVLAAGLCMFMAVA